MLLPRAAPRATPTLTALQAPLLPSLVRAERMALPVGVRQGELVARRLTRQGPWRTRVGMEVSPPRTGAAAQAGARRVPRERGRRAAKGMALTLMAAAAAAVTAVRQRRELMEQATATAATAATALQGQVGGQEALQAPTRETQVPWAAAAAVVQVIARLRVRLLRAARVAATRRLTLRTARA